MKEDIVYICPQTKTQCDDECCVSAEDCHAEAINSIISNCEPEQLNKHKIKIENLTPKEKARELINRQYSLITGIDIKYISEIIQLPIGDSHYETAKQSALITVCHIIEQWQYIHAYIANGMGELNPNLKYWYEVEEEITNQQEQ